MKQTEGGGGRVTFRLLDFGMTQGGRHLSRRLSGGAVYLYGRKNLVTLERSSLMKERGNISLDSCAVYLK